MGRLGTTGGGSGQGRVGVRLVRRATVVVLVVAVVASDVAVFEVAGAVEVPSDAPAVRDVPPLPSDVPAARELDVPDGDFGDPPPLDGDVDRRNERERKKRPKPDLAESELVSRDEGSSRFRNRDGSFTEVLYSQPVNWRDRAGEWREIDNSLVARPDGSVVPVSSPLNLVLSGDASKRIGELSGDAWSLRFSLEGAAPAAPKVSDTRSGARYDEILPEVDAVYTAGSGWLKEELILGRAPDPGVDVRFVFPVDVTGLEGRAEPDGSIGFYRGEELVVRVPQGVMWDDRPPSLEPRVDGFAPVEISLVTSPGSMSLVVDPDDEWLRDPARKYPVTVDPTMVIGRGQASSWDAYTYQAAPNTNYNGPLQWDSGYGNYRLLFGNSIYGEAYAFMKFDTSALSGKNILGATWGAFEYGATSYPADFSLWRVAEGWSDTTVTWNNKPERREDRLKPNRVTYFAFEHPTYWSAVSGTAAGVLGLRAFGSLWVALPAGAAVGLVNWMLWRPGGPGSRWAESKGLRREPH